MFASETRDVQTVCHQGNNTVNVAFWHMQVDILFQRAWTFTKDALRSININHLSAAITRACRVHQQQHQGIIDQILWPTLIREQLLQIRRIEHLVLLTKISEMLAHFVSGLELLTVGVLSTFGLAHFCMDYHYLLFQIQNRDCLRHCLQIGRLLLDRCSRFLGFLKVKYY